MRVVSYAALAMIALFTWPASAASVITTMANAEVVIPDVPPMQAIEVVQDAMSGLIGKAPMSLKPIPDPLPVRPGMPGTKQLDLAGTPVELLDCPTATAEIRRETAGTSTRLAKNSDAFQACVYPFAKGTKVWLRAVNIDASESRLAHGLFSGITKAVRGTSGEWLTRRLNDFVADMKKKLPVVLVERIEAPGAPAQAPDREAVAALLPAEAPSIITTQAPPTLPTSPLQSDGSAKMIEARKNLTAIGLTYHNQAQFLDAVRRKDALAVKLFLDGGGVDPQTKGTDEKDALELARGAGAVKIVKLLEASAAPKHTSPGELAERPPLGAVPDGMRTQQQMTSEQQIRLRQKLIESMRQQQSQQSLEQLLFDSAGFSGAH